MDQRAGAEISGPLGVSGSETGQSGSDEAKNEQHNSAERERERATEESSQRVSSHTTLENRGNEPGDKPSNGARGVNEDASTRAEEKKRNKSSFASPSLLSPSPIRRKEVVHRPCTDWGAQMTTSRKEKSFLFRNDPRKKAPQERSLPW